METQTAPKRYVHNDFGDFGEPNNSQTLRIYWFWRFLGAKTGRVGRPKKLPNVTYTMISVILDAPKTLKRYAYNGFSDCGTCGCPKSSQLGGEVNARGYAPEVCAVYIYIYEIGVKSSNYQGGMRQGYAPHIYIYIYILNCCFFQN